MLIDPDTGRLFLSVIDGNAIITTIRTCRGRTGIKAIPPAQIVPVYAFSVPAPKHRYRRALPCDCSRRYGSCAFSLTSVTIVCDQGYLADGLSTACFVLGMDAAKPLLERYGAEAVFVDEDKNVYVTSGLMDKLN